MMEGCLLWSIHSDHAAKMPSADGRASTTARVVGRLAERTASMATSTKTSPGPLSELTRLLPTITHDELIEFGVSAQEELGRRANEYANAVAELDVAPRDLVNEALSFVSRSLGVVGVLASGKRTKAAWHILNRAEEDLREALNA